VVSVTPERYTAERLLEGLPVAESELTPDSAKKRTVAIKHHNKCSGVLTTALIVVPERQGEPITFTTMDEAIEYLKKLNLPEHLGLSAHSSEAPQPVLCPFHNDTSPSATISRDPTTGHWLFYCHSGGCHIAGTIIDLTIKAIGATDPGAAIARLMAQYDIQIQSEWKDRHKLILQANWDRMGDTKRLAKEFVVSERLQCDGLPVFFISLRELERRMKGHDEEYPHFGRQGRFIDRYCLLGLLRKLPDAALPADTLQQARRHQGRRRSYRIQFYQFPEYTDDVLRRADERARRLIEAGASVQGVSKQLIRDLFGAELADEVYPQSTQRPTNGGDGSKCRTRAGEKCLRVEVDKSGHGSEPLEAAQLPSTGRSHGSGTAALQSRCPRLFSFWSS
jgi:hypothetical protein